MILGLSIKNQLIRINLLHVNIEFNICILLNDCQYIIDKVLVVIVYFLKFLILSTHTLTL